MTIMYCQLCERPVDATRRVGGWTYVWAVLSAGLSLIAVPFYKRRCPICHTKALSKLTVQDELLPRHSSSRELKERALSAEEAMHTVSEELDRVRVERDFYRDLRGSRRSESADFDEGTK